MFRKRFTKIKISQSLQKINDFQRNHGYKIPGCAKFLNVLNSKILIIENNLLTQLEN
jgi:hypothetical protein